ncbi:MAG: DUF362 domain-containing protein [Planctomycetes bacterium]|nr:DUF362 domain-containing protein [Planctomycetota bacterium]
MSDGRPIVAAHRVAEAAYPSRPPFDPEAPYPEAPFPSRRGGERNAAYEAVREALALLGLDRAAFGTRAWNPLGAFVSPGDRVLIKPNLVLDRPDAGERTEALITHGSVIRAAVDFAYIALQGRGSIAIGDAPLQKADFAGIRRAAGLDAIVGLYREEKGFPIEIQDFRLEHVAAGADGVVRERAALGGDPEGYRIVDIGAESLLEPVSEHCERYRVTCYDKVTMAMHHNRTVNAYLIPKRVLQADVVINLPKLKTHRKAGITASLKNLIGINGHKDWLPHHRRGCLEEGGDEYPSRSLRKRVISSLWEARDRARRILARRACAGLTRLILATGKLAPFPDRYLEGSWYGNDTIWRTILDLNRILLFADQEGRLGPERRRRYLAIVDAIVAGEGEGPLEPTPKLCGVVLAGEDPAAVDRVCAALMGFDAERIPALVGASRPGVLSEQGCAGPAIEVRSNREGWDGIEALLRDGFRFIATAGWRGHIEWDREAASPAIARP